MKNIERVIIKGDTMRKFAALLICLAAVSVQAKDEALLNDQDAWKLYTAPEISFSKVNGDVQALGGLGIGTILNDRWTFGLAGRISVNDVNTGEGGDYSLDQWKHWYAGGELGYIFAPDRLVHLNPSVFVGAGEAKAKGYIGSEKSGDFLVVEPRLALCLNLHETWELNVGVGYRWTDGLDTLAVEDDDLTDITWFVQLRATEF